MTILNLFIEFINKILSIEILGFELSSILLTIAIIIAIFQIIEAFGTNKIRKSKGSDN